MIRVNKLYVLWISDDGDRKLIPKDVYSSFIKELCSLEYELGFPLGDWEGRTKDEIQQDIYNLIDSYETLEGEEVYIVFPKDVFE